jgi:hypothetical protein
VTNERHVLKLTIEESPAGCRVLAEFNSKEREAEVGKLPADFRDKLDKLQDEILQSAVARSAEAPLRLQHENIPAAAAADDAGPRLRAAAGALAAAAGALTAGADEISVKQVGRQLFDFIFQGRVLELYKECYTSTRKVLKQPLSIRLRVTHPGLSYVPWETLFDQVNGFYVTVSQDTPFMRALEADDDDTPLGGGSPIRILGMAARAKVLSGIALDSIDVDAEQVAIKNALGALDDGKRVKLCWIPSAKGRDLTRRFIKGDDGKRWDIFHFIGHGGHRLGEEKGFIVVQEDGGPAGIELYADDLRQIVCQFERTPNLVILNSCSGAKSEPGMLFSSVAEELIRGGVPAVIAMQFEISDNMGIAFSNAFYTYLVDSRSIQAALAHTRLELKASRSAEWISPVLYMRGLNGEIFIDTGVGVVDAPQ